MSAERDPQLGMTFNFSSFYELYRQEKLAKGIVLKSQQARRSEFPHSLIPQMAEVNVITPEHQEQMKQWTHLEQGPSKKDILNEMSTLRTARKRLEFLMAEVDQILKRS